MTRRFASPRLACCASVVHRSMTQVKKRTCAPKIASAPCGRRAPCWPAVLYTTLSTGVNKRFSRSWKSRLDYIPQGFEQFLERAAIVRSCTACPPSNKAPQQALSFACSFASGRQTRGSPHCEKRTPTLKTVGKPHEIVFMLTGTETAVIISNCLNAGCIFCCIDGALSSEINAS